MRIIYSILILLAILLPFDAECTRLLGVKVVDKDYLMVHFRDGEVRYRDNGTGRSAYLGHAYAMGDDSLVVFGHPLDIDNVQNPSLWKVSSVDDKDFSVASPDAVWRKSKPMNTDSRLISELDHWIFLKLPKSMNGATVSLPIIPLTRAASTLRSGSGLRRCMYCARMCRCGRALSPSSSIAIGWLLY